LTGSHKKCKDVDVTDKERIAYLEETVADRERRIFNMASLIRAMNRPGFNPEQAMVDYSITPEAARALGILNWRAAIAP
jgi:hypothetical protein